MQTTTPLITSGLAVTLGGGLLLVSAYLAARPAMAASRSGWAVVNGLSYAILGMAAAIRMEGSEGFRAALLQLVTVVVAGALVVLSHRPGERDAGEGLGAIGRGLAWLALVGLPPTVGFHAKVTLYRALLTAGWGWMAGVAAAVSLVLLLPALSEIRSPRTEPLSGPRAVSVASLIALTVILGFYPYLWLFVNAVTGRLAGSV